ncbi:MAG: hypothetical protein M3437_04725 [Chloroflexota bacterium]|nr:hypothetical protein [Chloroflexota bacterium]MDQ5867914.1 hypothetical protein [Chloroflexota bacterium]
MDPSNVLVRLKALIDILDVYNEEVVRINEIKLAASDTAAMIFLDRVLVRTVYSRVEGIAYLMKYVALADENQPDQIFSAGELALLREEDYDLTSEGIVRIKSARLSTLANLRFSFRAFVRALGINFTLNVGEHGWEQLRNGILVRDRITHPKRAEDLIVTDQEVLEILEGQMWFADQFGPCLERAIEAVSARYKGEMV